MCHRDDVAQELAERDIPFSIENMDVSDTPEVRDLFACVAAVVDLGLRCQSFSRGCVAAVRCGSRATSVCVARDCEGFEGGSGSAARFGAGQRCRGRGGAGSACARRAMKSTRKQAKARAALASDRQTFRPRLNSADPASRLKFAADWEQKTTTKNKELGEWIEYLDYFREAGGVIPLASNDNEDAVRLMTAHGAKGLEFPHVFILRATSGSFPASYRETLVEFPRELRDPDSAAGGDDKTLYDQEERRLFYVAMTRAKDSLHIYGKQGIGTRQNAGWAYARTHRQRRLAAVAAVRGQRCLRSRS